MIKQIIHCDFCNELMPKQIWVISLDKQKYDMCEKCNENYMRALLPYRQQKDNSEITRNSYARKVNKIIRQSLYFKE